MSENELVENNNEAEKAMRPRKCINCLKTNNYKKDKEYHFIYCCNCDSVLSLKKPTFSLVVDSNMQRYFPNIKPKNVRRKTLLTTTGIYKGTAGSAIKKAATRIWRNMRKFEENPCPSFKLTILTTDSVSIPLVYDSKKKKVNKKYLKRGDFYIENQKFFNTAKDSKLFSYNIFMKEQDAEKIKKLNEYSKLKGMVNNGPIWVASAKIMPKDS